MKKVTENELMDLFRSVKGTRPVDITYRVDEGKSITIAGRKQLQKEVTTNAFANADYENRVNKIRGKQGDTPDFVALLPNGVSQVYPDCRCLLKNSNGGVMLRLHINSNVKPKVTYFYKGIEISKQEAIDSNLFTPSFFNTYTVGRGSVSEENNFKVIQPFLKNIVRVKLNKEEYYVIH